MIKITTLIDVCMYVNTGRWGAECEGTSRWAVKIQCDGLCTWSAAVFVPCLKKKKRKIKV